MTPPSAVSGERTPTIDSVLFKLEEAMHACCDQPLGVDSMTLTRSWRAILEEFAARGATAQCPHCGRDTTEPTNDTLCGKCGVRYGLHSGGDVPKCPTHGGTKFWSETSTFSLGAA